jgi:hypothetical protein
MHERDTFLCSRRLGCLVSPQLTKTNVGYITSCLAARSPRLISLLIC